MTLMERVCASPKIGKGPNKEIGVKLAELARTGLAEAKLMQAKLAQTELAQTEQLFKV